LSFEYKSCNKIREESRTEHSQKHLFL